MERFYQATTLQEAYLLRDLLIQAGVAAYLLNEHAQGALGSLPFVEAYPELWLADAEQRNEAEAVLARYEGAVRTVCTCPACSEVNPGNFDICWNCGYPLNK